MADDVRLRPVEPSDLDHFYEHQREPAGTRMAAFPARERDAFMAHWRKILRADGVVTRAIVTDDGVAGNVVCYEDDGRRLVGYWLGSSFWGRGIATRALAEFVAIVPARPLHAFVAVRNVGSIRVLEKCGFVAVGTATAAPTGHGAAVPELLYELPAGPPVRVEPPIG